MERVTQYSEYETEGLDTGPQRVIMHFGEITSLIPGAEVTLRSDDGTTGTYALTSSTVGASAPLRVGAMARVVARKSDSTAQLIMASGR